jgi:hypothetical protein
VHVQVGVASFSLNVRIRRVGALVGKKSWGSSRTRLNRPLAIDRHRFLVPLCDFSLGN